MVQGSKFVSYCNALALHPLGLLAGLLSLLFIGYRVVSPNSTIFFYCSRSILGEARTVRGVARIIRGEACTVRGMASGKGVDVLISECADILMG